jgi:hypothetical protein
MMFEHPRLALLLRESVEVARPLRAQGPRGDVDEVRTLMSRPSRGRDCGSGAMTFDHPWLALHAREIAEEAR